MMPQHLNPQFFGPQRAVVLGRNGFVGAAVVCHLSTCGMSVLALGRAELDLSAADAGPRLAALLKPDDALVIAAAKAPAKTGLDLIDNLRMMSAVCDALRTMPVTHVVYISSDAVYADSDKPLTEWCCAQPESLHGAMHLTREIMLRDSYNGLCCMLRPTLIYGAKDPHNGYGPNRFLRCAARGHDIVLFGNGEEQRDHVFIDDVAEVVRLTLLTRTAGVLNIATGKVHSFRTIADMIAAQFTPRPTIRKTPRLGPMPHRGYRAFDIAQFATAFPEFKYRPLSEGLELMAKERAR